MSILEIRHLTKDYGNGKGVFDVSFAINEGEVFGFLGPNGAGKTTTIRHLLGFSQCATNTCLINDKDCSQEAALIQKELGYIPGEINLMEDVTGNQFIKFMAEYRGMKDLGRAPELIERFDLDPQGKIKKMSKGMKQKIGIVVAFMHDPQVLILDEPTSGLDPLMQNEFIKLILQEKERGKTILMSSHMFEEVEKTCDRVGIIRQGKMVSVADIAVLQKSKQKVYLVEFKHQGQLESFLQAGFVTEKVAANTIKVVIKNEIDQLLKTLANYQITSFEQVQQSLEEIFMHFYGGNEDVK